MLDLQSHIYAERFTSVIRRDTIVRRRDSLSLSLSFFRSLALGLSFGAKWKFH